MNALFRDGPYFDVRTKDCLDFQILKEKELSARWDDGRFERYLIPAQAGSDGASIPLIAQAMRPSLRERIFGAAVAHDSAYRKTLLIWRDGAWVNANLSEEDANELIRALMFIEATTEEERWIVFKALEMFGEKAYREGASRR